MTLKATSQKELGRAKVNYRPQPSFKNWRTNLIPSNQAPFILFHPAKQCSIFSIMPSQIDLALNEILNGRPRYFTCKEETLQTKILAKPSTLLTLSTGSTII